MEQEAATISIANTHPHFQIAESLVRDLVERVCTSEKKTVSSISIVLSDHATVHDLNRTYLAHDYETDVLSFPLSDDLSLVEGEIYVDLDTAHERCAEFGATFELETYRYIVHGLLHLLGYTDETPDLKAGMKMKEDLYLSSVIKS